MAEVELQFERSPTWNHLIKAIALMDEEKEAKVLQYSHPVTRDITSGMEHILCDNWNNVYRSTYVHMPFNLEFKKHDVITPYINSIPNNVQIGKLYIVTLLLYL